MEGVVEQGLELGARIVDPGLDAVPADGPGGVMTLVANTAGARAAGDDSMGGDFAVRPPTPRDAPSLALLWAEMQRHYGQPVADTVATAAATFACRAGPATGFDPRILLAVADTGTVVGALALNVTFPAGELTRSLYVRDLYVAEAARRRGIARSLLRAAAALTLAEGFSALDWTTDAGNIGAHRLYRQAGARQVDRVYFRLAGADLLRAAGS